MKNEIAEALSDLESSGDVKVVILAGAGRAFSSGHDNDDPLENMPAAKGRDVVDRSQGEIRRVLSRRVEFRQRDVHHQVDQVLVEGSCILPRDDPG